jgi:deazaflavin-dependent oxidoreductase (nitroreductase family)
MDLLDLVDRSWPVVARLTSLHTAIYRATGGWIGHSLPGGRAALLLDHVGARSGRRRTTPLLYIPDGDDLVVVASKGGHPQHPAWLHNLRANPNTTVQVRDQVRPVRARVAGPDEQARLWPKAIATYPPYETYQHRTSRKIPVVILEPRR